MSLLRREARSWVPEPIASPIPGLFGSSGAVTSSAALRVSSVWACVRLLADSVSMMPLDPYTLRNGVRVPQDSSSPLLTRPSGDASMPDWLYMLMVSALLRGNAYGKIVRRDSLGYPSQIELQSPDDVSVRAGSDGRPVYMFGAQQVPNEDVFHFRAYRFPGMLVGLSPIEYAARSIKTDAAVSDFALGFFRDGAHPSSVLQSDQPINEQQARTIKDRFLAAVRGREPAVLGSGLTFTPIQVSPEESQFLETQKYGTTEIARIFGVPPEMIAASSGSSLTYANVEQRALDYLTYSVAPWLTRIETALSALLPGKQHLRFDTSVLVRTDLETTMKATAIGIASKQMLPDEARALRNEPPLTDSQKTQLDLIPLTVSPTGLPKAVPVAPAPDGEAAA